MGNLASYMKDLPTPGKYEDANREMRNISVSPNELIEGFQMNSVKVLSAQPNGSFSFAHGISLGNRVGLPHYSFSPTLVKGNLLLQGRIDTTKSFQAVLRQAFNQHVAFSGQCQGSPDFAVLLGELEFSAFNTQASLKAQPNAVGAYVMSSLTKNASVGVEAGYNFHEKKVESAFAFRYAKPHHVVYGNVNREGEFLLSYVNRMTERAAFGCEFKANVPKGTSLYRFSYEYNLLQNRVRGVVDSSGLVAFLFEEKMSPTSTFLLSGSIHHVKKEYRFGFGLNFN